MKSKKKSVMKSAMRYGMLATIFSIGLASAASKHTQTTQPPHRMQHLNQRINTLQKSLSKAQKHRKKTQHALADAETLLGKLNRNINQLRNQQSTARKNLSQLNQNIKANQLQLNQQQTVLATQLRQLYILGNQPALKLLLSPQDVATTQRMMSYYKTLSTQLSNSIQQLEKTQEKINKHQLQRKKTLRKQITLRQQLQLSQHQQKQANTKRQHTLQTITQQIQTKQQHLNQLIANKKALENTLLKLKNRRRLSSQFAKQRGHLSWPIPAKSFLQSFNQVIGNSQLRTTSVIIAAKANEPVHAIASGRIIFARWLTGYGLLIIVDHGDGYISLYGRNQSLLKQTGDMVKKGTVIATTGKTGGYKKPGLYFAIRHQKTSLNPSQWCG